MLKLLTIAGSDCSGGAGIQADLKTFAAHGTYGMSVITALTAQNTQGVTDIFPVTPAFVTAQLDAVQDDIPPDAAKIGMVGDAEVIHALADHLRRRPIPYLVIDPVMVATSGSRLLAPQAEHALQEELLPLATMITPNLEEAGVLVGRKLHTLSHVEEAAKIIYQHLGTSVLIKGGHLDDRDEAIDVLFDGAALHQFSSSRLQNPNTHGTGCTLSAAIAVGLAQGLSAEAAVRQGKDYVHGAIADGMDLGHGRGPLNHLYRTHPTNA